MRNEIVALAQQYVQQPAQAAVRRAVVPAAFGLVAAVLFLVVLIALFAALFFWLSSLYGPVTAALVVAAVALVLGLIALLPLVVGRRQKPAPPPAPNPTPQLASLLAQTAPSLALKRPLLDSAPLGGRAGTDGARRLDRQEIGTPRSKRPSQARAGRRPRHRLRAQCNRDRSDRPAIRESKSSLFSHLRRQFRSSPRP